MGQHKKALLLIVVALFPTEHASAAIISWSAAQNTTAATNVLTTGTLVQAINGTTSTTPATLTVNTVPFTNVTSYGTLNQPPTAGFLDGASTGDANFNSLLDTAVYGGGTSTTITIGAGSLLNGQQYLVQIFYTDERVAFPGRVMTYGDNLGNNVNVAGDAGSYGQYAVGSFTANATSQTLSLVTSGFGNAHLNAFQVRLIPEPSSGALLLAAAGLICTRGARRRRAGSKPIVPILGIF